MIKQSGDSGELGAVSTVKSILDDSLKLITQHLELFRIEIQSDFRKTKEAALYLGSGIGLCLPGIIFLCLMVVHLLHALNSPRGQDSSTVPLWGCNGIVGVLLALPGFLLGYVGVKKFQAFNPLPDETVNTLIESWGKRGAVTPGVPSEH